VTPGLIGISLGRNPSGAISQIREAFLPLRTSVPGLVFLAVSLVTIWALRTADVIANWPTAVLSVLAPIVALAIAQLFTPEVEAIEVVADATETEPEVVVPLEWIGIARPFTDEDVRALNVALGVSEVELYGATGG
jgi:branched-chain amino acid transport system permease protein